MTNYEEGFYWVRVFSDDEWQIAQRKGKSGWYLTRSEEIWHAEDIDVIRLPKLEEPEE